MVIKVQYTKYLKDNTCFIVPNSIKREILLHASKNKLLMDVCFFSINEIKKKIFFDYDEKTIYYISKQFNLSYDDSVLMINNLYYINSCEINDEKYKYLKKIKKYLDDNNLLIYSDNFIDYINKKNIVTSYGKTSFFNEKIFSLLNNVNYIYEEDNKLITIYEFDFIEDEIE